MSRAGSTPRWTVAVVCALVLAVALSLVAPALVGVLVLVLAVPLVLAGRFVAGRRAHGETDPADLLLSAAAALAGDGASGGDGRRDATAALRDELAGIEAPRERRRFAGKAALALLGPAHRGRSVLVAAGTAVVSGAALLCFSRFVAHGGGLGTVSVLVPPVLLFVVGFACARAARSLRFGLETGVLAVALTLVAVAAVYGIEAAHWFDVTHASVLDGEPLRVITSRAAVLDAMHPVILLVHVVFWLPWPVLGAVAGVRARRRVAPAAP